MKKFFVLFLTLVLCLGCMSCMVRAEEQVELTFMTYLEQYPEQLDKLTEIYKEAAPNVTLKIETIGGDYDKILQTRITTDEVPDLFLSGPYNLNHTYAPVSLDLTNEAFINEIDVGPEFQLEDGTKTGIPFSSQAWGILYNKDVFEEVGITEAPLTLSALKDACETLTAAGKLPFVLGFRSSYIIGQLMGFPYGFDPDCRENCRKLTAKEANLIDFDFIQKIFDMTDLVKQYTQEDPYNDDFASAGALLGSGDAAMMISGDWIISSAEKANPDARIGLMPLPVSEDPEEAKIYSCDSIGLHVSNQSKHQQEALDFVNWLVTSQEAKDWFSKDMRVMTPVKGTSPENAIGLAEALEWVNKGHKGEWGSYYFPDGIDFSEVYDLYFIGKIDRETAISEMNDIWADFE